MPKNSTHIITVKPTYKKFIQVGEDELAQAIQNLSPATLALYMYMVKNKNGYEYDLSFQAFHNWSGYSKSSYERGKKELKEKSYLVPHTNKDGSISKDWFEFHTKPYSVKNDTNTPEGEKISVKNDTNDSAKNDTEKVSKMNTGIDKRKDNETEDSFGYQTTFDIQNRCLSSREEEGTEPEVEEVKEKEIQEEIQVDGEISKTDLQMVLKYEVIGENLVRFSTGKIFRVV